MRRRRSGRASARAGGAWLVTAALAALAVGPVQAAEAATETELPGGRVMEATLSPESLFPGDIAVGPDGNAWVLVGKGQPGHAAYAMDVSYAIDRVTPSGVVTEFPLGNSDQVARPSELRAGPLNSMWYLARGTLGRVAMNGEVTEFSVPTGYFAEGLAAGPDGNLWFTRREDTGTDAIVRVTPSGQSIAFPLPNRESGPSGIAAGPDGNLWFSEYFGGRVGRITPQGELTEFNAGHDYPREITAGADGNLWFTAFGGLGRITPLGRTSFLPDVGVGGPIAAGGPEPAVWLAGRRGSLETVNANWQVSTFALPGHPAGIDGVAAGPDGSIWYSADPNGPCRGGGGTCMSRVYSDPGTVGRIFPERLPVEIGVPRRSHGNWARVPVHCVSAASASVCEGRLEIDIWGSSGGESHSASPPAPGARSPCGSPASRGGRCAATPTCGRRRRRPSQTAGR